MQMHRLIFCGISDSLHSVDLLHQLGLEVGSLVLVDNGTLGEFINDGNHLGQALGSDGFVLKGAEVTQGIAHGLGVITVLDSFLLVGTNSFLCRNVMCHNCLLYFLYCFCSPCGIRTRDFKNENLTS